MSKDGYVDVAEAAALLGITRQGVWHRIRSGRYNTEKRIEGKREWVEIPLQELQADIPSEPPIKALQGRTDALHELLAAIHESTRESREDLARVLQDQLRIKDEQIRAMEERTRRLEQELEQERISWWRRIFG